MVTCPKDTKQVTRMNRRSRTGGLALEHSTETVLSRRVPPGANSAIGTADEIGDRLPTGLWGRLRHNRLLIAGVMTAAIALGVLAIFTPRFETNDDVGMNAIVAGRLLVDRPDEHLVFSNVLIGLGLKGLYQVAGNVPWYGGYLFLTASLSLAAVAFVCLKRDAATIDVCLTAAFLCLAGAPFLIVLQFTRVAFLATLAGLLLLAGVVRDARPVPQAFWAIPFLVAGALIRIDAFLLAVLVLSPLAGWMLWRSRTQASARAAVAILAGAVAVGFALVRLNNWYYARDEGWRDFYKFNSLRVEFTDYGRAEYNDVTAPVFAKVGWTRADVDLLREWCFLDRDRFNIQTLQTALEGLASRERATEPRPWRDLLDIFRANTEVLALWACGALFLIVLKNEGSSRFVCAGCYFVTSAMCLYLYHDFHLPARVFCPAFAACAVVAVVLPGGPRSIGRGVPWTRSVAARTAISVLLGGILLWRSAVLLKENGNFVAAHSQAEDLMRHLKPRPDKLFIVWGPEFPSERVFLPLDSGALAKDFKVLSFGSLTVAPFTTKRLQEFGVSDLYSILRRRRGIFFICNKWENGTLAAYFRDHYRLKIGGAVVVSHPALAPAAVYSLGITGMLPVLPSKSPLTHALNEGR
jgi:hypothetical protein